MNRRDWLHGAMAAAVALPLARATAEATSPVRLANGEDLALIRALELAEEDGRIVLPSDSFRVRALHLIVEGEDAAGPRTLRIKARGEKGRPFGGVSLGRSDSMHLQWRLSMPDAPPAVEIAQLAPGRSFGAAWGGPR